LAGGAPGRPGRLSLRRAGIETEEALSSKVSGLRLENGDILRLETAGGGGHGAPADRDAAAIAEDRAEGYVTG
jgi:N-methylhydantoinase B